MNRWNRDNDYDRDYDRDDDDYYENRYPRNTYVKSDKWKLKNDDFNKLDKYNSFVHYSIYTIIKNYYINHKLINNKLLVNNSSVIDDPPKLPDINSFDIKINMKKIIESESIKYVENKNDYMTKKRFFTLLTDCGAGIFGGSIRDSIIHDYGAQNFYDHINNDYFNKDKYVDHINLLYCDDKFHPESYIDRNTIFNDIDTVMTDSHLNTFLEELDSLYIKYEYVKYHDLTRYININNLDNLISSYIVLTITIDNKAELSKIEYSKNLGKNIIFNYLKKCFFKIDILLCKEDISVKKVLDKITSNSDFYCNSIYLFNNKLEINEEIANKIKKPYDDTLYEDNIKKNIDIFLKKENYITDTLDIVKTQILERKAISINLTQKTEKRINKIKSKGFKIIFSQNIYECISCNDEVCILCRDDFTDLNEPLKLKCCNSYYHKECLLDISNSNKYKKCLYCAKELDYKYLTMCLKEN